MWIDRLDGPVGADVGDVDREQLREDPDLPNAILAALEDVGVLVFRGLELDPETQVSFCERIGPVETNLTNTHPVKGVTRITFDRTKSAMADYVRGNFGWHIDGCTPHGDDFPPMATMLTVQTVAQDGDTEFASTYAAYEDLDDEQKRLYGTLRVRHSFENALLPFLADPTGEQLKRLREQPTRIHPLVWNHRSGRRSLVIGTHAERVEDIPEQEGRELLRTLLENATRSDRVYRHRWAPGDTVMWDNRGLVHRVSRYDTTKPREMFRTTVLGQEPIQPVQ
jgi:alpha-ketoglutarate-dependent taurine dioxygenase